MLGQLLLGTPVTLATDDTHLRPSGQFEPVPIGVFTLAKVIMELRNAVAQNRTQAREALDGATAGLPAAQLVGGIMEEV